MPCRCDSHAPRATKPMGDTLAWVARQARLKLRRGELFLGKVNSSCLWRLVGVARRHLAGDLGAFLQVAADDEVGGRRAGAIALLEAAITTIEGRGHPRPPLAGRGLRL